MPRLNDSSGALSEFNRRNADSNKAIEDGVIQVLGYYIPKSLTTTEKLGRFNLLKWLGFKPRSKSTAASTPPAAPK
jgi:hypothetical protein